MRQRLMALLLIIVLFYLSQDGLWSALVPPQASDVLQLGIETMHVEVVCLDFMMLGLTNWNSMNVEWAGIMLCAGVVHI